MPRRKMRSERFVMAPAHRVACLFTCRTLCIIGGADEEGGRGGKAAGARSTEAAATTGSGTATGNIHYRQ